MSLAGRIRATTGATLSALCLVTSALLGCAADPPGPPSCPSSSKLVPTCAVTLGVVAEPNTAPTLSTIEHELDLRIGLVYRFHDLDDDFPTNDEREIVKSGRILHISIDARIFEPPAPAVNWASVAAGTYDSALTRQARGIASLGAPVFVTFDHEPDNNKKGQAGSPADFVNAWRHVHAVFAAAGATNAVWVWVVTGYPPLFATAATMWPGNAFVDWIGWEAYNTSGCLAGAVDPIQFKTFAESALPFYLWVKQHGAAEHIDTTKPMMISEAGSVLYTDDLHRTASWYAQIPAVLAQYPQIHAITLWDHPSTTSCPFQFDHEPVVRAAVAMAGRQLTTSLR